METRRRSMQFQVPIRGRSLNVSSSLLILISIAVQVVLDFEYLWGRQNEITPEKNRYPLYRRLVERQGLSGRAENLVPTGIRSRTIQPVAQSLYRLSYPAHTHTHIYIHNHGATAPSGPGLPHYLGVTITHRHITTGGTFLDEGSARSKNLYLTTHNTHNRQTSMPPVWLKPAIPAGKRPHTRALDSAATGTGLKYAVSTNVNE